MAAPVKDKEAYQRLNYLYQAAHCVLAQNPDNVELARFYCFTQKKIARRLVLRQDPSVKRTLCKKCCSLLVPGVTATTRQKRKKGTKTGFTVSRCLSCGHSKKLLNDPEHVLWVDRPEAQQESQNPTQRPEGAQQESQNPTQRPEGQQESQNPSQRPEGQHETPTPSGSGKAQAKRKNTLVSQQSSAEPSGS